MEQEISANYPFVKEGWLKQKAREYFEKTKQTYKLELIDAIEGDEVSIYKHGDFIDLCRGPHIVSTKEARFFKLLSTSAAYWRGKESNPQLFRIYGTVFPTQEDLNRFLYNLQEAKKRDHRILGRSLELFDIYHNEAGAGFVFYPPKGAVLKRLIEDWEVKEHTRRGYKTVITPHIMNKELWETSGHLKYYADYMYPVEKDNQSFILKPMNCPGHILIYKSRIRSWKELPLRLFELGTVYRHEKSGVLHGLFRLRGFTQDDAHIFCGPEHLYDEIEGVLDFVQAAMVKFGFKEFSAELSTRPQEFIGEEKDWDLAEQALEGVLKKKKITFTINEGDGAFYGPKIDIKLKDTLNRSWQCATIQLDYNLPKKFNLTYRDTKGGAERVIMIHRVVLGSLERFIGVLIEHYAGDFPLWLAPIQACVLNVTKDSSDYALKIKDTLKDNSFRAEADIRDETLQKKIREKELEKIPYVVIVGNKEKKSGKISLRKRGGKNLGEMSLKEFMDMLKEEVK